MMNANPQFDAIFESYPDGARERLLRLRSLIHEIADANGAGPLTEALKWGQPAFLTEKTGIGSTVRIDATKRPGEIAVYFICHTRLVDEFRTLFPNELRYEKSRAIVFGPDDAINEDALAQCLAMALTYKRRRR